MAIKDRSKRQRSRHKDGVTPPTRLQFTGKDMSSSPKLSGQLRVWSLSDNPKKGKKYFHGYMSYGQFRRYVNKEVYNPIDNTGEQREAINRDVSRLKSEIANENYTPQVFNLSVTDLSIVNVDEKGNVILPLYEDNRLAIMDGGTRQSVLEILRKDEKYTNIVDRLPIDMLIYLDPEERKQNFINLNGGKKVNRSHIQAMQASTGRMKGSKLELFQPAMEIVKLLNNDESSPLHNKIGYGQTNETGLLQLTQVCPDHKASLVASFLGSVKILKVIEKNESWFAEQFRSIYDLFLERTDYIEAGKLLALPPDGAKGNIANWISIVNTVVYYLYLKEEINQSSELEDNASHIINCASIYNDMVSGDVSRGRRQKLSGAFAQKIFYPLESVDELPTGMHMGIPISLLINTSESSFGVEKMS